MGSWSSWFLASTESIRTRAITLDVFGFSVQLPLKNILDLVGTCVPGLVVILLLATLGDQQSRKELYRALIAWRIPVPYYVAAVGVPILAATFAVVGHTFLGGDVRFAGPFHFVFLNFIVSLPQSPLWEEIGWRGFLLPKLQAHLGGLKASLAVGLIWGLWHVPLRFQTMPTNASSWASVALFLLYATSLSMIFTWFYNRTKSLVIAVLLHEAANLPSKTLAISAPREQLMLFALLVSALCLISFVMVWREGFWRPKT